MAADHFQPWVPQQGHAAFVWSFMAAAAERTSGDVGPGVTCPSFRLHPAIVAQAAATHGRHVPGPLLARAGLGRGAQRARRRRLLARGARADGACARRSRSCASCSPARTSSTRASTSRWRRAAVDDAREPPPIYVATAGPITAERTGGLCDGLITAGAPDEKIKSMLERSEGAARPARTRRRCPSILQIHLSWAETDEQAMANALDRVAQRRHEVPQAGHPLAARTSSRWPRWCDRRTSRAGC